MVESLRDLQHCDARVEGWTSSSKSNVGWNIFAIWTLFSPCGRPGRQ